MRRTFWIASILIITALISPVSALANQILLTTPAQNSVLTIAPNQVTVTGSALLQDMGNQLIVTGPDGVRVDDGSNTVNDKSVTVGLRELELGGVYLVSYELLGVEDALLQGTYSFTYIAPAVISSPSASPIPEISEPPASINRGADYFVIGLLVLAFIVLIVISRIARNTFRK